MRRLLGRLDGPDGAPPLRAMDQHAEQRSTDGAGDGTGGVVQQESADVGANVARAIAERACQRDERAAARQPAENAAEDREMLAAHAGLEPCDTGEWNDAPRTISGRQCEAGGVAAGDLTHEGVG